MDVKLAAVSTNTGGGSGVGVEPATDRRAVLVGSKVMPPLSA
jgi:hypothetical protein